MNIRATTTSMVSIMLVAICATVPAYANDEDHDHREHASHEHGVAQLNIAQEGKTLHMELESPAMNIVGFEHMPGNSQQHAAVEHAVAELKKGDDLFRFSAAANCKLMEAKVESGLMSDVHDKHDKHDEHDEHANHDEHEAVDKASHADFDVSYLFRCSQPERLNSLEVGIFTRFPATEELVVQMISDRGQKQAVLTPSSPSLEF